MHSNTGRCLTLHSASYKTLAEKTVGEVSLQFGLDAQ